MHTFVNTLRSVRFFYMFNFLMKSVMEKNVYTIVYFKNGEYFMVSSKAFKSKVSADRVATRFCEGRMGDGEKWTYDIEKMILR